MTTIVFFAGAFLLCFAAATRSLRHGLLALMTVGYGYGILRANFPDTWTYLAFDAGVLGVFAAQLWRPIEPDVRRRIHDLRLWLVGLMAWPGVLFFLLPTDSPLVELVGLRANVFFLPFLLLGARLTDDDFYGLTIGLAGLNVVVVGVGVIEFFTGIEQFYPRNEVTDLIYRSKDLVGWTAYRIPATFSSAHAFAGTMVMTLPLLVGAWVRTVHERSWHRQLLAAAIAASLLGVFMAAARVHMISAALLVLVVTVSGRLRRDQWLRWAVAVGLVAYVVAGQERLQRFTTLQDTTYVAERWAGSVNDQFFEAIRAHPLGNGLAGGGTSVPYFLRGSQSPLLMENEYARLGIELGLPGLTLWLVFLAWVLLRWPLRARDEWALGRALAWVACGIFFFTGLTGTGLLSSVPQTILMLLLMGWFVTAPQQAVVTAPAPFVPRARRVPAVASRAEPTGPEAA